MFDDFARQWTPLTTASALKKSPQRLVLAGTPLVAWRDADGRPAVLLDRCPHRSVSLALGTRTPDGHLACGFHGWEFDGTGACRHLPFNPDADLAKRNAIALPTREAGGLIWVFTGFEPEGEPVYSDHLDDPSLTRFEHTEEWDCHWTRAMENMLDYPHLPYVHKNTIGRFVRAKATRHSRLSFDLETTDHGFASDARLDDAPASATLSWYRPNAMILDTFEQPRVMRIQIFCIPAEANRTRMLLVTARNFAQNPAASTAFNAFNVKVLHQDRAIVESSDPPEVPAGSAETSVPTDRPTLTFRTWYQRQLKGTSVDVP